MPIVLASVAVVLTTATVLLFLENRALRTALGDALAANRQAIIERDAAKRDARLARRQDPISQATRSMMRVYDGGNGAKS